MENSIESIQKLLIDAFNVNFLEVIDESSRHKHHAAMRNTTEKLTHIYIRIKAPELLGLPRVVQHRRIYHVLQSAMDNGLHAVRIDVI